MTSNDQGARVGAMRAAMVSPHNQGDESHPYHCDAVLLKRGRPNSLLTCPKSGKITVMASILVIAQPY